MKKKWLVALSLVAALGISSCSGVSNRMPGTSPQSSNPPIQVTLDKVGVHHNGEGGLRAVVPGAPLGSDAKAPGEIYVHIIVTDGKATSELRLPAKEGTYYEMKPDETVVLNKWLFYTSEVGDSLTIAAVGYEADGGTFEQLVYQALGLAIESRVGGEAIAGIMQAFNLNLGSLLGRFTGVEHDFMGSYEETFTRADNWGVGSHYIPCQVDGVTCLKLWFTIERGS